MRWRRRQEPERPLPGLSDREPPPLIRPSIIPPEELRPLPGANAWPDAAVLLTYAELRQLVALHLDLCSTTMPADRPWDWMRLRAGAIRDGEAPLLLSEVMQP